MKIIKRREPVTCVSFFRNFEWNDGRSGGFMFDCDEHGTPILKSSEASENYRKCLSGEHAVTDLGIERREHTWIESGLGLCEDCGSEVYLDRYTNTCECGADYDSAGNRLAPREQWGEETGECASDLLVGSLDLE